MDQAHCGQAAVFATLVCTATALNAGALGFQTRPCYLCQPPLGIAMLPERCSLRQRCARECTWRKKPCVTL